MELNHVICADIMTYHPAHNPFPRYDILWTDPPYRQQMLNYFQTMLKKATGKVVSHQFDDIIAALGKNARTLQPLFVDYSPNGWERVVEILKSHGHTFAYRYDLIMEQNKLPGVILAFNTDYRIPPGLNAWDPLRQTIKDLKPGIIFDPFAGIGASAKTVLKAGAAYRGSEINPKRFERLKKIVDAY